MIRSSIEKLSYEIGFDIGMSDDITQGKLLNGLSDSLCKSMNSLNRGKQLCYLQMQLDNNTKTIIKELYEYIKLGEENQS